VPVVAVLIPAVVEPDRLDSMDAALRLELTLLERFRSLLLPDDAEVCLILATELGRAGWILEWDPEVDDVVDG